MVSQVNPRYFTVASGDVTGQDVVYLTGSHIWNNFHAPGKGDALWAWKSFLRGYHPILMDFGIIEGVNPPEPYPAYEAFEAARFAMGDKLQFAERMKLMEMKPHGELSSTGYALAHPGEAYLIL